MRLVVSSVVAVLLSLAVAAPGLAATVLFQGTVEVPIGTLEPIQATGTGVATVNGGAPLGGGTIQSLSVPAAFAGEANQLIPITDPNVSPIAGLVATATNQAGTFTNQGGFLQGQMGVDGLVTVCLFDSTMTGCASSFLPVPLTSMGMPVVGFGGTLTATANNGAIAITAQGAPWTMGVETLPTGAEAGVVTTMSGFAHGPASGGISTAAAGDGVVQLVTPIRINTNISSSSFVPAFGVLKVRLMPEPQTSVLIAAAVGVLTYVGRKRLRNRPPS